MSETNDTGTGVWLKPKQAKALAKLEAKAAGGKLSGKKAGKLSKLQDIATGDAFSKIGARGSQDPLKKTPQIERDMMLRAYGLMKGDEKLRGVQSDAMAEAADLGNEQAAVAGRSATDFFRQAGGPAEMPRLTDQAIARGRGLARLFAQGDAAVKAQGLKEQLLYSKFGRDRAGLAIGGGMQQADMAAQRSTAQAERDAMLGNARMNLYGSLAGAAANFAPDAFNWAKSAVNNWRVGRVAAAGQRVDMPVTGAPGPMNA